MEQKKEFTGVFIPRHILECEQLNVYEKQLYAEISCFDECYLSNETLAKRLGCTEVTITRYIKKLKDKGYIEQTRFDGRARYLRSLKDDPKRIETSLKDEAGTSLSGGQTSLKDDQDNSIDNNKKEEISFFRNPKESARFEELKKHTGSSYEPDGNSPLVIREEIKKLEKQMKLRETPEKVKFMFTAGWQFFNWYKSVVGLEYHGGILSLDPVAKLLSEWYDRGMNEMGVTRLVSRYFKSRKAKEGVITPTSCFSEHTFQAFVQKKLK